MINQDTVLESLRKVIDPETGMNVVTMGLIRELQVLPEGILKVVFRPSSYVCPLAYYLAYQIQKALQQLSGIQKVDLSVIDFADAEDLNGMLRGEEKTSSEGKTQEEYPKSGAIKEKKRGIAGKMVG